MLVCYTTFSIRVFKIDINANVHTTIICFLWYYVAAIVLLKEKQFSENILYNIIIHFVLYFTAVPALAYITGLINRHTLKLKVGAEE